ncbi:MAG: FAD-binding oxidoreductase [Candidatus Binatia bacterium]
MTGIGDALTRALGADRVAEDAQTLAAHRLDYWFLAHLREHQGRGGGGPACVVKPRGTTEVATVVRLAQQHGVALVPYGGGSGVLGGAVPPAGALVVDLRAMDELLELNETALTARAQAGMMGDVYEATITKRGYTTGHYPQSIARATVGGLVATRSAGQFSTKYGNIEDLLLGLEAVLPSGNIVRLDTFPRSATGPQLRELFLGSEGALGIITEATLKIFPLPERRELTSFAFASMADGLEAIRRIVRPGWRPAVVRLYDQLESARHFGAHGAPVDACMLLVVCEGPAALASVEMRACTDVAEAMRAIAVGAEPVSHWLDNRNNVPSWDFFLQNGLVVDTIEVAATWDRVTGLYDRVVASLREVPGILAASAHSSHSYGQGTNLYITFAIKPEDYARAEELYLEAWGRVMETTIAEGGTIAHHHGIGRLRVPWLERELKSAYPILQAIKRTLDPAGLMNPGTLLP